MADLWYNDAATWRKAKQLWYNDGGTWRAAKQLWYNDGGTWRKVFAAFTVAGGNYTVDNPSVAQISFSPDGSIAVSDGSGPYNWGTPTTSGIGSQYWIKFTDTGGTGVAIGTFGSWLQLSSTRTVGCAFAGSGLVKYRNSSYQIATDAAGATVVASGTTSCVSNN